MSTLYDPTLQEIEFLDLVRALPPEATKNLVAIRRIIVARLRAQLQASDGESSLDG